MQLFIKDIKYFTRISKHTTQNVPEYYSPDRINAAKIPNKESFV